MSRWYILLLSLCTIATALQVFPDTSVDQYDDKCANALATNITACLDAVGGLSPNEYYSQHGLDAICKDDCRDALQSWEKDVAEACPGVTYDSEWGTNFPIKAVPSTIAFNFGQTCLKYQDQYCNLVMANITKNDGDACDKCFLLELRNEAQFPYGSGPKVYSSIYPSYTSSCGYTGYPVTVTPTGSPTSSHPVIPSSSSVVASPTPNACSGKMYTIKDGDDCHSVSQSQSVATMQLLMDNELQAYCANFPTHGQLCIKNQCTVYTVKEGDTCKSVAKAHGITTVQLRSYNPWIDGGCYNFNRTVGTEICMDEPGAKYHPPTTVIGAPSTATAAVPAPTNAAANTNAKCGEYYQVQKGDDCSTIVVKYGIAREDFLFLNPSINTNCTNLLADTSYCVMPVGSIDDYPNAPGHINFGSYTPIAFSDLPDSTYTPILNPNTLPLAPGTLKNCRLYAQGTDLQYNLGSSQCAAAQFFWDVTAKDLLTWNPSLRAKSNSTCSFSKEYRYCMQKGSGSTPLPSSTPPITGTSTSIPTSTPTNTSPSQPASQTSTTTPPPSSSTETTTSTTTTATQTSTSTTTTSSSSGSVPSPTQSNSISPNCNKYAEAQKGDNCYDFAKDHSITPEQLYAWNTVLGADGKECNTMFQANTYYCVGVSG